MKSLPVGIGGTLQIPGGVEEIAKDDAVIGAAGDQWSGVETDQSKTRHLPDTSATTAAKATDASRPLCEVLAPKDGILKRIERYEIQVPRKYRVPYTGAFADRFPEGFPLAVTSSLSFKGFDAEGRLLFHSITDRGPNGESPKYRDEQGLHPTKTFASPNYAPLIGTVRVRPGVRADLIDAMTMKHHGTPITGRPIPPGKLGATGEVALDENLKPLPFDEHGLDPEGLAIDPHGNFWIADEYGPFLVHVDAQSGELLQKLEPGNGLPESLTKRPANRGFEGCACSPKGVVFAAIQSPMEISEDTFVQLVAHDPAAGTTKMFGVRLDPAKYLDLREAKIGDIAVIDEQHLLVIEQGKDKSGAMQNYVSIIDLSAADDLVQRTADSPKPKLATMTQILDLRAYGWPHEKCEALSIIDDHTFAVGDDNDFGMVAKLGTQGALPAEHVVDASGVIVDGAGKPVERDYRLEPMSADLSRSELWIFRLNRDQSLQKLAASAE